MAGRLRILHCIRALSPGGAERQLVTLAMAAKERHDVFVAALAEKGRLAEELEAEGIPVCLLGKRDGIDWSLILRLSRLLKELRIDVVHSHLWGANFYCRLAGVLAGTCVRVIHEHSTVTLDQPRLYKMDRWLAPFTDAAICVSSEIARGSVRLCNLSYDQALLIRNGIEIPPYAAVKERRSRLAAERRLRRQPVRVVIVGALEPRKDHHTFLKAARMLLEGGLKAEFLIAGDGPLRNELEAFSIESGLSSAVKFMGECSDVPAVLAESDVYVSSSATEGISIALLEAMAAGVPAVVTAVGGTVEVDAGTRALLLVPPGDAGALAAGIRAVAQCEGVGATMAAKASEIVARRFDAKDMKKRVLGLYDDIYARKAAKLGSRVQTLPKRALRWCLSRGGELLHKQPKGAVPPHTLRILMYHRVRDGFPEDRLGVSTRALAQQLFALREWGVEILPLREALAKLNSGGLPAGAVSLTFDDGFADLTESALAVCEEFGVTATVYLPVGLIDAAGMIGRYLGQPNAGRLMTWDEAKLLESRGWEIGAHGITHRELTLLDPEARRREIEEPRRILYERLGVMARSFAYPRGFMNSIAAEEVRDSGYDNAVSVWPGPNRPGCQLYALSRTEVSGDDTIGDFACKLHGGFDAYQRRLQRGGPTEVEGSA